MFVATMRTNSLTVPHQVNPCKENTHIGNAIEWGRKIKQHQAQDIKLFAHLHRSYD